MGIVELLLVTLMVEIRRHYELLYSLSTVVDCMQP